MGNCKYVITLSDNKFKSCGDLGLNINNILQTDVNNILSVDEFEYMFITQLIDVKSRKVISSYPLLKSIYDRYKWGFNSLPNSSKYDYYNMVKFTDLVGNYWVDLIEQVVPSTTIWGSTYKYSNTIFDSQKFVYKKYTLKTCTNKSNIKYPSPTIGLDNTVDVDIIDLSIPEYIGPDCLQPTGTTTNCSGVLIEQINHGSEFIGSINIIGNPDNNSSSGNSDTVIIRECDLLINEIRINYDDHNGIATFTPVYAGGTPPYTFTWSIEEKTKEFVNWNENPQTINEEIFEVSGPPITSNDGDRLCVRLVMEDLNGCLNTITTCIDLYDVSQTSPPSTL